ncbi:MAG: hypothetical protein KY476_02800 [Planctomycetes bacterium]|nr:hypothetical protein [Planctomycetota bacterium]
MRDPDRIQKVLERVGDMWRRHPDWRLGQLLCNVATWAEDDVWDIEEDVLTAEIDRHIEQFDRRSAAQDYV